MKNLLSLLTFIVLTISVNAQKQVITVTKPATLVFDKVVNGDSIYILTVPGNDSLKNLYTVVSNHTEAIAAVNRRADGQNSKIQTIQNQVNNLPSGSGTQKPVTTTSYTITAADNGTTLLFKTKCTVSFSGLTAGFKCTCHQESGNLIFVGTNPILNKFGYTRSQTVGAWVDVIVLPSGISLKGDLTK